MAEGEDKWPEPAAPLTDEELTARQGMLEEAFNGFPAVEVKMKSLAERKEGGLEDPGLAYAEVEFGTIKSILGMVQEQLAPLYPGQGCFLDLGSGCGKPCIAAGLLHPFAKVVGVEMLGCLNDIAAAGLGKLKSEEMQLPEGFALPEISFVKGDFAAEFDAHIAPLAPEVTICLAVATCFGPPQLEAMAKLAALMPNNAVLITVSQGLPESLVIDLDRIPAQRRAKAVKTALKVRGVDPDSVTVEVAPPVNDPNGWTLMHCQEMQMMWGAATCFVYKKLPPKALHMAGTAMSLEAASAEGAEIPEGLFMVGVTTAETKEALLKELEEAFSWAPDVTFSPSMPMFAGKLDKDKILWLLKKDQVAYIEAK